MAQRRVAVVIYAVEIIGQEELPTGITVADFSLADFAGRAEIKPITSGKRAKKKEFNALILSGEWQEEDQQKLLDANPEKKENDQGEEVDNPAHAVVKKALQKWNENWKKIQKKATEPAEAATA